MNRTPGAEMRRRIASNARQALQALPGSYAHDSARLVQQWLDGTDTDTDAGPPPNTKRVRVLMDVSPPYEQDGSSRIVYVTKIDEFIAELQIARAKLEPGWRRSIGVLDAPVPEPIAVIVGTVETP